MNALSRLRPILFVAILLLLGGCREDLLSNINERQANEAVALLQKYNIVASKVHAEKSQFKVVVETADFAASVDLLNVHGLPSRADVDIADMFPADALVSTPTAERARLLSGIEQRLERSLMQIDQVITARVHASYDLESADRRKTHRPTRLSVLVTYEGEIEEGLFIEKVKRFIKNSFNDIHYADIAVTLFKHTPPLLSITAPSTSSFSLQALGMGALLMVVMLLGGAWLVVQRSPQKGLVALGKRLLLRDGKGET
ncbi:type III secretion inner membrane ring lipoprotein SctJ [Pseudomonas batumici]|uniref:type III secretion system inner membrane ring lipoprotein SctJ n=1 Tax=Pseudomonas batumici TaxID=226910 RepID=UPI0030CB1DD7